MRNPDRVQFKIFLLAASGFLTQGGCYGFFINELEALHAPGSPANALAVFSSVFFDMLAPLFY